MNDTSVSKNSIVASKFIVLFMLYSVQGLPFGFFLFTLPIHLRSHGFSLSKITFLSIINFPWLIKFLWAPLVDKYWLKSLGRRKSWILPAQGGLILSLLLTGYFLDSLTFTGLMIAFSVVNLFASTQDIAVDGLAVDILDDNERGIGNSIQAAAFKIGMLGGGFGLTFIMYKYGLAQCLYLMALMVFIVLAAPFFVRENNADISDSNSHVLKNIYSLFARRGFPYFILFLMIVKSGDSLANPVFRLFLYDQKFSIPDINYLMNMGGITSTLLGSALCGLFILKLGRKTSLIISILGQGISHFMWALLAFTSMNMVSAWSIALIEHFVSGMLTVVIFTIMMDVVNPKVGSSQYTILMCIHLGVVFILGILSGRILEHIGYTNLYLLSGSLTLVTLILITPLGKMGYLSGKRIRN